MATKFREGAGESSGNVRRPPFSFPSVFYCRWWPGALRLLATGGDQLDRGRVETGDAGWLRRRRGRARGLDESRERCGMWASGVWSAGHVLKRKYLLGSCLGKKLGELRVHSTAGAPLHWMVDVWQRNESRKKIGWTMGPFHRWCAPTLCLGLV